IEGAVGVHRNLLHRATVRGDKCDVGSRGRDQKLSPMPLPCDGNRFRAIATPAHHEFTDATALVFHSLGADQKWPVGRRIGDFGLTLLVCRIDTCKELSTAAIVSSNPTTDDRSFERLLRLIIDDPNSDCVGTDIDIVCGVGSDWLSLQI